MAPTPSPSLPLFILFFSTAIAAATVTRETSTSASAAAVTMTHLHFYFHEIISGPNSTTVIVAGPPGANASSISTFGQVAVVDDMLREGPDPGSTLIGRAQGLAAVTSLQGSTSSSPLELLTVMEFMFTEGEYEGSTLEIMGRFVNGPKPMERSIVGGSGRFRMAKGYALATIVAPPVPGYLLMEVDAYIEHN